MMAKKNKEKKQKRLALLAIAGQTVEVDIDDLVDNLITIAEELDKHVIYVRHLIEERKRHDFAKGRAEDYAAKAILSEKVIVGYEGAWAL